jgi:hypothetical protein
MSYFTVHGLSLVRVLILGELLAAYECYFMFGKEGSQLLAQFTYLLHILEKPAHIPWIFVSASRNLYVSVLLGSRCYTSACMWSKIVLFRKLCL